MAPLMRAAEARQTTSIPATTDDDPQPTPRFGWFRFHPLFRGVWLSVARLLKEMGEASHIVRVRGVEVFEQRKVACRLKDAQSDWPAISSHTKDDLCGKQAIAHVFLQISVV